MTGNVVIEDIKNRGGWAKKRAMTALVSTGIKRSANAIGRFGH